MKERKEKHRNSINVYEENSYIRFEKCDEKWSHVLGETDKGKGENKNKYKKVKGKKVGRQTDTKTERTLSGKNKHEGCWKLREWGAERQRKLVN